MTRCEYLQPVSVSTCSVCDREVSVRDVLEFTGTVDTRLHGDILCRDCRDAYLTVCRECSGRYTADGLCGECAGREYGLVG